MNRAWVPLYRLPRHARTCAVQTRVFGRGNAMGAPPCMSMQPGLWVLDRSPSPFRTGLRGSFPPVRGSGVEGKDLPSPLPTYFLSDQSQGWKGGSSGVVLQLKGEGSTHKRGTTPSGAIAHFHRALGRVAVATSDAFGIATRPWRADGCICAQQEDWCSIVHPPGHPLRHVGRRPGRRRAPPGPQPNGPCRRMRRFRAWSCSETPRLRRHLCARRSARNTPTTGWSLRRLWRGQNERRWWTPFDTCVVGCKSKRKTAN